MLTVYIEVQQQQTIAIIKQNVFKFEIPYTIAQ